MPSVHPNAAMTLARDPRASPAASVNSTPVPGDMMTISDVTRNSMLNGVSCSCLVQPILANAGTHIRHRSSGWRLSGYEMSGGASNQMAAGALSRQHQETAMSIVRLIHIKIDPSEMDNALRVWKTECAPLMIRQKGCISEKLLRCREAHELISYSEWDTEADIELYRGSDAHSEIVRHARALKGAKAEVKLYDLVT